MLKLLALIAVVTTMAGCSSLYTKRVDIPSALISSGAIQTTAPLRYWGDDPDFAAGHTKIKPGPDGQVDFLTLSGGGINGAYGAGYLVGWTQKGTRPEFEVVTGISVGAIMAPLAFLGSAQDGRLHQVYSALSDATNPRVNFISALFGAPAVLDNAPVRAAIQQAMDQQILDQIGAAHREGRRLYIGTTNLDAQRPVIWDIGAIANSGAPNRLELVRDIILASAAVPTIFQPVLLEVSVNGQRYSEMHVDGGITGQVLLMPGGWGKMIGQRSARLYVIFNGVVDASPATVQPSSVGLAERTLPTLLKYLGRANLAELANTARASGVLYRMTAIPGAFPESSNLFGSPEWLASLFQYGIDSGRAGVWRDKN